MKPDHPLNWPNAFGCSLRELLTALTGPESCSLPARLSGFGTALPVVGILLMPSLADIG